MDPDLPNKTASIMDNRLQSLEKPAGQILRGGIDSRKIGQIIDAGMVQMFCHICKSAARLHKVKTETIRRRSMVRPGKIEFHQPGVSVDGLI